MITINARGARTIADSKPLIVDGQQVYVTVGTETAELHMGGRIVAERPAAEVDSIIAAQDWAYETLDAAMAIVADEAAVAEAINENAVYAGAVAQVRAAAAPMAAAADELDAMGNTPYSYRNARGRKVTVTIDDPRHPARRAASMRREFKVLSTWTATDEAGYARYVSQGIGDTDGHYAPLGRFAWKATS